MNNEQKAERKKHGNFVWVYLVFALWALIAFVALKVFFRKTEPIRHKAIHEHFMPSQKFRFADR